MPFLYERVFPRFRPKRELRPQGSGVGWGARLSWLGTAGFIIESRETTLLVDPFITRPGLRRIVKPFVPDDVAIARHVPRKVDAIELYRRALQEGITIAPGPIFSARQRLGHFIRLNAGIEWTPRVEVALERLGQLAAEISRS